MGSVKTEPDKMDTAEDMDHVDDKSSTPGRQKRKYSGGAAADNGGGGGSRGSGGGGSGGGGGGGGGEGWMEKCRDVHRYMCRVDYKVITYT